MNETLMQTKAFGTLAACLRGGRLPHALLIEGGDGPDRLELARHAAQGALCAGEETDRPCGVCRHCAKVEKGIHPDLLFYGSEGGARSFHIDVVREMRQQAFVRPNEAEEKVFLLENVQDLSVQAQNALLKIIEEPPANVRFLLLCENKSHLLETILSRVTVCSLEAADGGGEEELLQQAGAVLMALSGHRELDALESLSAFERDRTGLAALLEAMRRMVAALLVKGAAGEVEQALERRVSRLQMLSIVAIIDETAAWAAQNGNGVLVTTTFCARVKRALE